MCLPKGGNKELIPVRGAGGGVKSFSTSRVGFVDTGKSRILRKEGSGWKSTLGSGQL